MTFGENKWIWIGIMAVVVAIAVILGFILLSEPFRLIVLYDEVGDLKKEDPVVWKEFTIGKVEQIQPLVDNRIGVTIRLREDYATRITRGSEFVLKRTAFLGLVGSNAIEVITPSTPGTPFARGEKILGKITPKTSLLEDSRKWTLDSWNRLRDATSALVEEFRTSPYKKEAEDALSSLKSLAEEGAAQAKEGLQHFRKNHSKDFEDIVKKLEILRDQMRKKGDERAARQLGEQIEKIRQSAEIPPGK